MFFIVGALHLTLGLNADVLLGAKVPAETLSDPALDSQNRFYGVAFMVSYLSEKLRVAREELLERQKTLARIQTLYANVIASMSSGLVTADSHERVTFLNQAGGIGRPET